MRDSVIGKLSEKIGDSIHIEGKIKAIRDHGKMVFIDVYDRTGEIQCFIPQKSQKLTKIKELSIETVINVQGVTKERPEANMSEGINGNLEFSVEEINILSKAEELPFDIESDINIDTNFDYRPLTLRRNDSKKIFSIQAKIVEGFREYLNKNDFKEIQTPSIVGGDAEGGAGVFSIDYFDKQAFLATSPQLYKQIMVGVFERVYSVGNVFRAEKHATTRHLNEYTSLDFEMGYIEDHKDIMDMLEGVIRHIVEKLKNEDIDLPILPKEKFPSMKLSEVQDLLYKVYKIDCKNELDLSPEHEKKICEYAKEKLNSDFIFVTHYPTSKRPLYAFDDEEDKGFTKTFDLLMRGVEITSGGQRIHDFEKLKEKIKTKLPDTDVEKVFQFYLQAFKYGMPPHGGIGMGLERLTALMLNISNVKLASLFPRDRNRIDTRLYE